MAGVADAPPDPNCARCGSRDFVDVPHALRPGDEVRLLCCAGCMAVLGTLPAADLAAPPRVAAEPRRRH